MRDRIHAQLERQTREGVGGWNARVAAASPADEAGLRAWLSAQGVTGYPQMLLVWETFGYPDFLLATAGELVDARYADRPALRPVFDAVIAAVSTFGEVSVQARKTYVSLVTPANLRRRSGHDRQRVDLGLRLTGLDPQGPLLDAKSVGNDAINLRIGLSSVDDLGTEALAWLRRAYDESK